MSLRRAIFDLLNPRCSKVSVTVAHEETLGIPDVTRRTGCSTLSSKCITLLGFVVAPSSTAVVVFLHLR
jgi:hypothetical protein